eukprot:1882009-Pleurochrysis_carterae.AAC.1
MHGVGVRVLGVRLVRRVGKDARVAFALTESAVSVRRVATMCVDGTASCIRALDETGARV